MRVFSQMNKSQQKQKHKKTKQKQKQKQKRKQKERVETVETQSAEDYLFLCDGGKHSCF